MKLFDSFDRACVSAFIWIAAMSVCQTLAGERNAGSRIKPGEVKLICVDSLSSGYSFETKAAIAGNRDTNGLGKVKWGLAWHDGDSRPLRGLEIRWGNERLGDPLDRRFLQVTVDSISPEGDRLNLAGKRIYEGADMYGGWNTLSVEDDGKMMNVWIGNDLEYFICAVPSVPDAVSHISMSGNRDLKVEYVAYVPHENRGRALATGWTYDGLMSYLESGMASGPEGIWRFLDRDTNVRWAEPGGKYSLAVVRSDRNPSGYPECPGSRIPAYDIIYLDGGRVNASSWNAGMLKGRLYSTIFEHHYELEWFDADMEIMDEELSADVVENVILTLNFPLLHSTLRFSRDK